MIILAMLSHASFAAGVGDISPTVAAQIASLYQEKTSWTPAQCKLDSELIHGMKVSRSEAYAPGAPDLQLDLQAEPDGRVLVDIEGQVTANLLTLITQEGGQVSSQFPQFHAIRAMVTLGQLEALASSDDVITIRRAARSYNNTGSVDSQGDITHQAALARTNFGVNGSGVKIGVLSDSVDMLSTSQASGDLGAVSILSGQSGTPATGEGTAMLEIIHDLAPGAELYFATASYGEANFAQNILNLRSAGCDIIVDDEAYFDESPFQDGVVARAINEVTDDGALYFTSAGNAGSFDSGSSGTWEGDFVDGGKAATPVFESARVHSFGPLNYNTVAPGGTTRQLDLYWSDPLGGSTNDYDVFILNSAGTTVLRSSTTRQNGTQSPYESVSTLNVGERIVIVKYSGAARFLHLDTYRGQLTFATAGATHGHSAAGKAFSVAAVDMATAYPGPFTGGATNPVEVFSSDGPRHVFFNADGTPITPGNFLSSGGGILQKPDFAAADDVATSVAGFISFSGTSAAAPHTAAIAALLKSYNPALTSDQMRAVLLGTTLDIMAPGVDQDAGAGILMAQAALQAAPPDALFIVPGTGVNFNGTVGGPFAPATRIFPLSNNGTNSFNWSLTSTSPWLVVSPSSGTLTSAAPAITVIVNLTAAASNLASGVYTATILFTNLDTHVGQSREITLTLAPLIQSSTYSAAVLALNPIAYWRLNETNRPPAAAVMSNSGSLGNIGTGLGFNGVETSEPGIVGTSFHFSNPSQAVSYFGSHVDVPYASTLNPTGPFTVEFWVKPAQFVSDLFCPASSLDATANGSAGRLGWLFYQSTNKLWQFRLGGSSGYVTTISGGTVQTNTWQHLVGVYDGTQATLYVNGVKVAGPTSANGFAPNTTQPLRLGATTIPNRTYDGWVDEFAFYTNALSDSVIASHYNTGIGDPGGYSAQILTNQPVGYWHLDDPEVIVPPRGSLPIAVNMGSLAPNGNGIYQPGTLPGAAGLPGSDLGSNNFACNFNGTSYIDVPGTFLNLTGQLTLLAWVNLNAANGISQSILSKGALSYRLFVDGNGYPHFADGAQTGGDVIGAGVIADGLWHQLAGVYDGTNTELLYVDGQSVATNTSATNPVAGNSVDGWLGGDPDAGAFQLLNGKLDEAAIFTNALSATQIQQLFSAATITPNLTPSFTGVVANTNFTATRAITFTWSALAGKTYELQYTTDLNQKVWKTLSSITANSNTASASDGTTSDPQRFYRVILLP